MLKPDNQMINYSCDDFSHKQFSKMIEEGEGGVEI